MNLTGYVEALRQQLAVAAAAGGDEARALAERLTAPLDAAARLVLLDALSAAAGEITRDLAPGSVDLRLRDREPTFVVTLPPAAETSTPNGPEPPEGAPAPSPEADDAAMVRINLRLPEHLKSRVEAAANQAGLSVNAWLVRAAATALDGTSTPGDPGRRGPGEDWRAPRGGQRFTGWVR
jgi:HicB family